LQVFVACLHAKVFERRFGSLDLQLRVLQLLIELRVDQLENDAVGGDGSAGEEQDALDPAQRGRGNPSDVFGHERPGPADLVDERTAFDRVDPQRRPIHAGSRRLEAGDADGDEEESRHRGGSIREVAHPFPAANLCGAGDIHMGDR
jgi:hypothetical protein